MRTRFLCLSVVLVGCDPDPKKGDAPCSPSTETFVQNNPGYKFKPANWACWPNPMPHSLRINADSFSGVLGIAIGDASARLNAAIATWMAAPGHSFTMSHGGATSSAIPSRDGKSVAFADPGYDRGMRFSYAINTLRVDKSDPEHAVECDTVFFKQHDDGSSLIRTTKWTLSSAPASDEVPVEAVWLHELGHCVGLADGNTSPGSVMNYATFGVGQPVPPLSQADKDAIKLLY